MGGWLANLRKRSPATRTAVLGLAVLAVGVLVTPVALCLSGWAGLAAAAAAAGFCLLGAGLALAAGHVLRGPKHVLHAVLAGMAARMGIPLALGLGCHLHGGTLAEAGCLYYLLIFYPVTLTIETALSLPISGSLASGSQNVVS